MRWLIDAEAQDVQTLAIISKYVKQPPADQNKAEGGQDPKPLTILESLAGDLAFTLLLSTTSGCGAAEMLYMYDAKSQAKLGHHIITKVRILVNDGEDDGTQIIVLAWEIHEAADVRVRELAGIKARMVETAKWKNSPVIAQSMVSNVVKLTAPPDPSGAGIAPPGVTPATSAGPTQPERKPLASSYPDALLAGIAHTLTIVFGPLQLLGLPTESYPTEKVMHLNTLRRIENREPKLAPAKSTIEDMWMFLEEMVVNEDDRRSRALPDDSKWGGAEAEATYWSYVKWVTLNVRGHCRPSSISAAYRKAC